jgi:hypothetical protein
LPAFGAEALDQMYVGSQVVINDNILVKNFVQVKPKDDGTHTLFISGGNKSNEYERAISIHGKTVSLYASENDDEKTSKTTNSNIRITSSIGQIKVSNSYINISPTTSNIHINNDIALRLTSSKITDNEELTNYLKTTHPFMLQTGKANN